jgi:hypothetical protein
MTTIRQRHIHISFLRCDLRCGRRLTMSLACYNPCRDHRSRGPLVRSPPRRPGGYVVRLRQRDAHNIRRLARIAPDRVAAGRHFSGINPGPEKKRDGSRRQAYSIGTGVAFIGMTAANRRIDQPARIGGPRSRLPSSLPPSSLRGRRLSSPRGHSRGVFFGTGRDVSTAF